MKLSRNPKNHEIFSSLEGMEIQFNNMGKRQAHYNGQFDTCPSKTQGKKESREFEWVHKCKDVRRT